MVHLARNLPASNLAEWKEAKQKGINSKIAHYAAEKGNNAYGKLLKPAKRKESFLAARKTRKTRKNGRHALSMENTLYLIALAMIIMFIATQATRFSAFFGLAALSFIIIAIVFDFVHTGNKEGYKKELIEIAIAIGVVFAIWVALIFAMHTTDPLNVVPSCSMLPVLSRGDLIIIKKVEVSNLNAPIVNVSNEEFQEMYENMSSEFLVCLAYKKFGSAYEISQEYYPGDSVGLFENSKQGYIPIGSTQNLGLVRYYCGIANATYVNGTKIQLAYTKAISINGHYIQGDRNNSIIVYKTIPQDYFYATSSYIVHRVYAVLNVSGTYYALTKGDNNPGLDMQYGNYPVNERYIEGELMLKIPYIGYIKLLMSNNVLEPSGCNLVINGSN
ncbi:MAG: hypothetical protein QW139_01385 [Candidatus Micrarchaeaceae archaeon]